MNPLTRIASLKAVITAAKTAGEVFAAKNEILAEWEEAKAELLTFKETFDSAMADGKLSATEVLELGNSLKKAIEETYDVVELLLDIIKD